MFELGTSLREARRREGLALSEVEAATKNRTRYPRGARARPVRGAPAECVSAEFLGEYAEFLGLDADVYTAEYESRFGAPELELSPRRMKAHEAGRLSSLGLRSLRLRS